MSLFLELKYARILGQSLLLWKIKNNSPFSAQSRCPICLDSNKSKTLCRFHVREYQGSCFVNCFNCGYSTNLVSYLKVYHPSLYSEFVFERYRVVGKDDEPVVRTDKPTISDEDLIPTRNDFEEPFSLDLPYVSDLPKDHPARLYVASRKLPRYPFQYAENFYDFSSQFNKELSSGKRDEPRLIIPFYDRKGSVFSYQGRDLSGKSKQKYITITVDTKVPKIFGVERCDFKTPIKIVEGPLDALFLSNCLASVNASLMATAKKLSAVVKKENITLIYDCEPRNAVICDMYEKAIDAGYKIVIWPNNQIQKDINDLVMSGKNPEQIVEKHTYSGLMAQLKFHKWVRI